MSQPIPPAFLRNLKPLDMLDAADLEMLAEQGRVEAVAERSVIFRKDSDDHWLRYLLAGEVVLARAPGEARTLVATGREDVPDEPLAWEPPWPCTAVARTDARLLLLPRETVQACVDAVRPADYAVEDLSEGGAVADRVFAEVAQDLLHDRLELPTMPDLAIRVREAIADPDADSTAVARILQADPVVVTRLIKVANSAMFSSRSGVDTLTGAIVRLGLENVRHIVIAVTLREVFRARHPLLQARMAQLWEHSARVAAVAALLGGHLPRFVPERALLGGLLHSIGGIPLLTHLDRLDGGAIDEAQVEALLHEYAGQLGGMILRNWNFPEAICEVPAVVWSGQGGHAGNAGAGYPALILVADALARALEEQAAWDAVAGGPAWVELGMDRLLATNPALLDEAREEIERLKGVLGG
ncbi:HD-like signal output (HDOD) protein [Alkalispirillum mobile]|uniref:HD-like signal output (HDOD) protein n=1 Tax=Alkalispirillum mobile TaxID=85925 RepID=A0A498BX40_9GAMM|nr:HDOD domain-containing protein [Alkalispirillum mobile]RLK48244.1 HD-like signal output (HDOD) protein [Alkalispirillum mobile]